MRGIKHISILTRSTTEAELTSLDTSCVKAEWLRELLMDLPVVDKPVLAILMDNSALGSLLVGNRPTTSVVEKAPPPTEIVPFKIPTGIIDHVMANRYAGDGHPGDHLLYLS